MEKITRVFLFQTILPAVLVVLFFINAALPKTVLGCANRGLVAIAIAVISLLAAVYTTAMAVKDRRSDPAAANKWLISSVLLLIPTIALFILA